MTLKLPQLPKRTPIKVTTIFPPDVHDALMEYAAVYQETYGQKEKVEDLIPFIVAAFLDADSGFKKARKQRAASQQKSIGRPPMGTAKTDD